MDTEALARIVDYVTEGGVEFIVVLGTTSEAPTLTKDEKRIVRETIIKANKGRFAFGFRYRREQYPKCD